MRTFFVHLLAGLIMAAFGFGCASDQTHSSGQVTANDSLRPDTDISGATIYMFDRDRVTAAIKAQRITRFDSIDSTMGYSLDIDMFDSAGTVVSELVGDSGLIREQTNELHVYGNVVLVVLETDTRLKTDSLLYDPATTHVKTDDYVEITRGNSIVKGWGLEADRRLDTLRILRTVSGRISDLEDVE